jgi:uncharacterized Zn finger protein (UPF0148 family)
MSAIQKILERHQITKYQTVAQLRSNIGKPLAACPACGQPVRLLLHDGTIACGDCRPELWDDELHRPAAGVALILAAVEAKDVPGVKIDDNEPAIGPRGILKSIAVELDHNLDLVVTRPADNQAALAANLGLAPGFRIVAVAGPLWPTDPGAIAFDPSATQEERRAAVAQFEWSDLIEARAKKTRTAKES